jgi:hypothetical protein
VKRVRTHRKLPLIGFLPLEGVTLIEVRLYFCRKAWNTLEKTF